MICETERTVLRELAKQVADIAAEPIMETRRTLWRKHNALKGERPMILVFPEGSWRELIPDNTLVCTGDYARFVERELKQRIYAHKHFFDDSVVEKEWGVPQHIVESGWGLAAERIARPNETGAFGFKPVINSYEDLKKLKHPTVSYNEEGTMAVFNRMQEVFGDIMDVRVRGACRVSFHMMNMYTAWRGLDQVMLDMCTEPQMLHDAMSFLEEGLRGRVEQMVELNLLDLNNDHTYHSSGGVGYSDELPKPGFDSDHVRPCDIWASAEAQEMAQVGPEMHEEFVLQYERRLLEPFGLNGYGCCEDLTLKLDDVFTIANIRRISIAPWANVDVCAEKLGGDYIFSWKPHPAHLVGDFNPEFIRNYIQHTVDVGRDCVLEMILKDTHTCEHHPERFTEWTRVAREIVGE